MSKLWTAFQTQYRISAAYEVSVVLIESDDARHDAAAGAAPGRRRPRRRPPSASTPPFPGADRDRRARSALPRRAGRQRWCSADTTSTATPCRCASATSACDSSTCSRRSATPTASERHGPLPDDARAAADWPRGRLHGVARRDTHRGATDVERVTNEVAARARRRGCITIGPEPGRRDLKGDIALTVDVRARGAAAPARGAADRRPRGGRRCRRPTRRWRPATLDVHGPRGRRRQLLRAPARRRRRQHPSSTAPLSPCASTTAEGSRSNDRPRHWARANEDYLAAALAWLRTALDRGSARRRGCDGPPAAAPLDAGARRRGHDRAPAAAVPRRAARRTRSTGRRRPRAARCRRWPRRRTSDAEAAAADAMAAAERPWTRRRRSSSSADRFGLSRFERDLLLLCVAMRARSARPALCGQAQADPRLTYPTFALAFDALRRADVGAAAARPSAAPSCA